jgi:hypothetical protein
MKEDQLQEGRGRDLFTVKNLLLLVIGFVLGHFLKVQAMQTIAMGYDDYKLSQWQSVMIEDEDDNTIEAKESESSIQKDVPEQNRDENDENTENKN